MSLKTLGLLYGGLLGSLLSPIWRRQRSQKSSSLHCGGLVGKTFLMTRVRSTHWAPPCAYITLIPVLCARCTSKLLIVRSVTIALFFSFESLGNPITSGLPDPRPSQLVPR